MGLEGWGLVVGVVSAVAAVVPICIELYGRFTRGRTPAPAPPVVNPGGEYDVFVSYAEADRGTAETLADRLHSEGLRVFLAEWIGPGLVESLEKEAALNASTNGILVFSATTMNDTAIRDEYAALIGRAHTGGRLFVPVLVEDVELPPFARIRRPVDLREPGSTRFDQGLTALVRSLQPRSDAT
jgi:hypothetical protein